MDGAESDKAKPTERPGLQTITEGEFAGWKILPRDTFEWNHCGPFYSRRLADGTIECAFKVDRRHLNGLGVVHGGVLMTFADHALFHFAQEHLRDAAGAVTATFNSEFLGAANEGDVVEARGEVTRGGRSIVFVRGMLTANGEPCLSFSAALKKVRKRG